MSASLFRALMNDITILEIIDLLVNMHNFKLISLLHRHLYLVYIQKQHKSWAWSTSTPSIKGPKDSQTYKFTGVCCSWVTILSCTSIRVMHTYYSLVSKGFLVSESFSDVFHTSFSNIDMLQMSKINWSCRLMLKIVCIAR